MIWEYSDLDTIYKDSDVDIIINKILDGYRNFMFINNWTLLQNVNNIKLYETIDNEKIYIKTIISFTSTKSIKNLAYTIYNLSEKDRKEIYTDLNNFVIIKQYNDNTMLALTQYNAPFSITPREFLCLRNIQELSDGSYIILISSVNSKNIPFNNYYIRGITESYIHISIDSSTDNLIKIETIDHINPKGWIPQFIVNNFKFKAVDKIIKIVNKIV